MTTNKKGTSEPESKRSSRRSGRRVKLAAAAVAFTIATTFAWSRFHKPDASLMKAEPSLEDLKKNLPEGTQVFKDGNNIIIYAGSKHLTQEEAKNLLESAKAQQQPPPQEQKEDRVLAESDVQTRDSKFETFRSLFTGSAINFGEAKKKIKNVSGITINDFDFALTDAYNLTATKRFYAFDVTPVVIPSSGGSDSSGLTITGTNHIFDTSAAFSGDGRIHALASYILSKDSVPLSDPAKAVKSILWWVMNNVKIDVKFASVEPITVTGESPQSDIASLKPYGYGVSNNHPNSLAILRSSGVCIDFTNLAMDLLNSVGIPSRTVLVGSTGLYPDHSDGKGKLRNISHTLIQVYLPQGTSYYDITPKLDYSDRLSSNRLVEIASPEDYILSRFMGRYPDKEPFKIICLASLPVERFASYPQLKEIFDQDMAALITLYNTIASDSSTKNVFEEFLQKIDIEYCLYYADQLLGITNHH